jgi:hypothetical protein
MNCNDPQLVLRDVPIFLWLFGLIFGGVGLLILVQGGPPVMGGLFLLVGLGFLLFTSALTITADRITRMLTLDYRSVFRHTQKQMSFDDIAGINVERSLSSGRKGSQYTYRLAVLRKDEQVIPMRSFSSSGWRKKEKRALQLREFIGIQDSNRTPSGMLPAEFSQKVETREIDGVHWQIQPMTTASATAPTGARWHSPDFKTPGGFLFVAQKAEGQSSGGFLASLGSMLIRQALMLHGFQPDDTPGLDQSASLSPLDPALEQHFMAYSNSPELARQLLNANTVTQLAAWAGRYPLKQLKAGSNGGQLMTLFGPNGIYLVTLHLLQPSQTYELISLGIELVKAQNQSLFRNNT